MFQPAVLHDLARHSWSTQATVTDGKSMAVTRFTPKISGSSTQVRGASSLWNYVASFFGEFSVASILVDVCGLAGVVRFRLRLEASKSLKPYPGPAKICGGPQNTGAP